MRYLAVFLALLLTLMGCGGSDSDTDSPTSATTATDGNGDTPTTSQTPTTEDDSDNGDISPANCPELLNWAMDTVSASQAAFAGGGPNAVGGEFTATYFQEFADQAPAEIRDDMQVFADAYQSFWEELAELGVDFTDPETLSTMDQNTVQLLEAAASELESDAVEQALDNIGEFFERECG